MKETNFTRVHSLAVLRGWVDSEAAANGGSDSWVERENASGGDLAEGTVVVLDTDGTITTTTTPNDTRPVGVVIDDIADGELGPVVFQGDVDLINVGASVTAGDFAETSSVAGEAQAVATRSGTSFGYFTSSGTTPSGFLFGGGGGGSVTTGADGPSFDTTPPQSTPLPPWVKPSGSGVITNDAQGRITVDSGSGYKAFPGMTFLAGRLHLVYRDGTGHNSAGGVIKYRYSDNLGRTWSSATTIASPAGTEDLRDPTITALSSGRLLLAYHVATTGGTIAVRVETIYSDNRGQSWSSLYVVPDTFSGEVAGSSPPLELPDGTIMLGGYGESGGNFFAVVWFSTDGGLTFGNQTTVASSGSRNYEEPQFRLLASGKIVGLLRTNGTGHTYRTVSTDGGLTWSAPADVLTAGLGRPDFVEFFPGALFLVMRQASGDNDCYWTVSWDEGATWTALQETDSGETQDLMYTSLVCLTPGYIVGVYSLEVSSTDADLYLRYWHDGYGIDPLGNLTVLSGGGVTIQDEGSPLTTVGTTLNFVGAGVVASGSGATKTVTIAGGASASDTNIWRPLMAGGAVIIDGTGQAVMAFSPA